MNFVEKNDGSAKTPDKSKRPYKTRRLSEYGDIRQITQNTPKPGGLGDSSHMPVKTQP
jgi:hypothetical protein